MILNGDEWVAGLVPGMEVAVYCGLGRRDTFIGEVTRITPSGNIAVIVKGKEAIYNKDLLTERTAVDHYRQRIGPLTQDIRDKIERKELSDFLQSRNYTDNYTLDQLRKMRDILYEIRC